MDVKVVIGFQPYHVDLKRISNHNIMYLVLKKERYRRCFFSCFFFQLERLSSNDFQTSREASNEMAFFFCGTGVNTIFDGSAILGSKALPRA